MDMDIRTAGDHVEEWREIVIAAIDATRPADELWSVTASEVSDGVLNLDFSLNFEASRSITLALPADSVGRKLLYRMSCYLLRNEWPGALEVH
jgi:hypothetical protein